MADTTTNNNQTPTNLCAGQTDAAVITALQNIVTAINGLVQTVKNVTPTGPAQLI